MEIIMTQAAGITAELAKGKFTDDLPPRQLQDTLRGTFASYAVPSRSRVQCDHLPLNHAGKVDKPALAATARIPLAV